MPLTCANALCRTIFPHIIRQPTARCRVTSCTAADQPKGPDHGHQQPSELASHGHYTTITRRWSAGTKRGPAPAPTASRPHAIVAGWLTAQRRRTAIQLPRRSAGASARQRWHGPPDGPADHPAANSAGARYRAGGPRSLRSRMSPACSRRLHLRLLPWDTPADPAAWTTPAGP
jgi:hypothetical protein